MSLGIPEMLFLAIFALLLFGPKKLPEIARQIGRAVATFRSTTSSFRSQLQKELQALDPGGTAHDLREIVSAPRSLIPDLQTMTIGALTQPSTTRDKHSSLPALPISTAQLSEPERTGKAILPDGADEHV
jgi:sec-independent protein translocase protein TatB